MRMTAAQTEELTDLLFNTLQVGNCRLKNRIVMPSLASFLLEEDGFITDKAIEHYKRRAAGGPAMVIMEACAVAADGIVSPNQARIYHDKYLFGLMRLAKAIKSEGAIAGIQLHHAGRQTTSKIIHGITVAPSPLSCPSIKGPVRELAREEIESLVRQFGNAAQRAIAAGFQLIEIHGAHGYLVNQFLSRFSNIRKDEYGGDIEGRTRFAKEIVLEIRRRIGRQFPLSFKISAQEFVENGLTVEESIPILDILVEAGIDMVQVSAGNDATPEWICQPMFMEKGCLAGLAGKIKKAIAIPVMAVGRINDPETAVRILSEGKADLVGIGRGLLADPDFPKKAQQKQYEDIRTCIACNTCMESIFKNGRIECLVNPFLGRESELVLTHAKHTKKVMVIGGGPGGLNAAWVAARRGHQVHLFEQALRLGGQLQFAAKSSFKREITRLIAYLKRQAEQSGVIFHLGETVNSETIKTFSPDVVIVATGSKPVKPPIEGIENPIVETPESIFTVRLPRAKKTVVIGGGPTGCEIALHLAEQGSPVTVFEMTDSLAKGLETVTRRLLLRKLQEHGVVLHTNHSLTKIFNGGVMVRNGTGEMPVPAQRVVIAIGNRTCCDIYDRVKNQGIEAYKIGDCLQPRTAKVAIFEGARIGCLI